MSLISNVLSLRHKYLYLTYLIIWILLAIDPKYVDDWLLENVLIVTLFPVVIWLDNKYKLSTQVISLLLIFGILHTIGAHYTYAQMPYFDTITEFFGFERNHFDRVVHFLFGVLVYPLFYEIVYFYLQHKNRALFFTYTIILSIATLYEIVEWAAAMLFHPDLGIAFLGTQGDVFDAQKDTLAAMIGALITLFVIKNQKRL